MYGDIPCLFHVIAPIVLDVKQPFWRSSLWRLDLLSCACDKIPQITKLLGSTSNRYLAAGIDIKTTRVHIRPISSCQYRH